VAENTKTNSHEHKRWPRVAFPICAKQRPTDATEAAYVECLRTEAVEAELVSVVIERDAALVALEKISEPTVSVLVRLLGPDGSARALSKNGGR